MLGIALSRNKSMFHCWRQFTHYLILKSYLDGIPGKCWCEMADQFKSKLWVLSIKGKTVPLFQDKNYFPSELASCNFHALTSTSTCYSTFFKLKVHLHRWCIRHIDTRFSPSEQKKWTLLMCKQFVGLCIFQFN